ncbi:aldolase/citrate lyase family protein [uncultured Parasphingorhabdus sp.]|uniref:HpcH/HpaI aldolase/citrate lyase family protein n=1 Tax=uncultured Parasphingorhabdus sp. TaxID=2709694 RepID=UPI002AA739EA|nr:aldolase/citrate lyase family protein [uncultured Parasphingorhabdus sp.]
MMGEGATEGKHKMRGGGHCPRSLLFLPASMPERLPKASASMADAIIIDLEDAVAEDQKDKARANTIDMLANRTSVHPQIVVRVNSLSRICGLKDIIALANASANPDYILLPKVEDPGQLELVSRMLADGNSKASLGALIESSRGVAAAPEIARADCELSFLMFGAADYAADLGQQVGHYRPSYAAATVVNAAACGGIVAIDSPFFDIADSEGLASECVKGKATGFYGKAAIHPRQVAPIKSCFRPTPEELARAKRILRSTAGEVGVLEGKMVDRAMVRWARNILAG